MSLDSITLTRFLELEAIINIINNISVFPAMSCKVFIWYKEMDVKCFMPQSKLLDNKTVHLIERLL